MASSYKEEQRDLIKVRKFELDSDWILFNIEVFTSACACFLVIFPLSEFPPFK
jgi:hypothetical protein